MTELMYAIQDFFMMLLAPMSELATLELSNWWAANTINWLFVVIGFIAAIYWLRQLRIFNAEGTERRDMVSHSFFK